MPSTLWSAPAQVGNSQPFVNSTLSVATLDMSPPGEYVIPGGMLNLGTRLRIIAWGSYISASSTTTTLAFAFGLNNTGTPITTTPAILTTGPSITVVASTMPWMLEYWGVITATTTTAGSGAGGQVTGRGRFTSTSTTWTGAVISTNIAPQTVGAQTVAATATGLITTSPQNVFVQVALGVTATGMTSITTNELTCELLG